MALSSLFAAAQTDFATRGLVFGMTNYQLDGAAMTPVVRKETWLVRVATHLLVRLPQLSAVEAARVAIALYEEKLSLDPKEVAAAVFADDLIEA